MTVMEQMRERVARAMAKAHGLDFDEICGVDADPDEGYCDSSTCVAAYYEEHDADMARDEYLHQAAAALSLMQPEIDRRVAEERSRLLERFDEDELEQIISNSLDMDWLPRDAARAIRQAMLAQYEKENSDG